VQELSNIIEILENKLKIAFKMDRTGHDFDHLQRTMRNALAIQKVEGGNIKVVAISALLHDVHRIMTDNQRKYISPKESLPKIREFISDLDITKKETEHICSAIENHEHYSFSGEDVAVTDIESLILQDADNLDATGAIGLARVFSFSFSHNIPVYNPNFPLEQSAYKEGVNIDPSLVHHCVNKLVRLDQTMNTETGKKLCINRCNFIRSFVEQFLQEWELNNFKL